MLYNEDSDKFNYIDFLQTSSVREQQSTLLDSQIQLQGRLCYVFLLDKVITQTSELYNSETKGRIYLPHFPIRALYKTNIWSGNLTLNIYEEQEDNLEFVFNFDRMVHSIRDLKDKITGTLKIFNKRKTPIIIFVEDGTFNIKVDEKVLIKEPLVKYNTIKNFVSWLNNNINDIVFTYEGDNEIAEAIKAKSPIVIQKGKIRELQIQNETYINTTDVIELGAVVVTDRMKAYQIISAQPSNDSYGGYIAWLCKANIIDMSMIDSLPNSYRDLINNHRYNLPKNKME